MGTFSVELASRFSTSKKEHGVRKSAYQKLNEMNKNCATSQITPTMPINTFKQIQMDTLTQIYRRRYRFNEAAGLYDFGKMNSTTDVFVIGN